MAVTAPLDGEMQHGGLTVGDAPVDEVVVDDVAVDEVAVDDLVIIPDDPSVREELHVSEAATQADPVMLFVYLGIITLLAIIATAAFLAL